MTKVNKRRVEDPGLVERRRPQIIDAAIEQFGSNGFHATTIRDIADHADVSIGMIYQYVQDKEDLLYLAIMEVVESYIKEIASALDGVNDPLERFISIVDALTRVIDQRRAAALLGYRESKSMSREHLQYVMRREREIGDMIAQCVGECIRTGVFRAVDVEMVAYQCIVFAHNWALNSWRLGRQLSVDGYIAKGLDLILNPLLADPGSLPRPPATSPRPQPARAAAKPRAATRRKPRVT